MEIRMQSAFLWTLGVCIVLYTTIPVALSASNTSDAGTQDSKNALVDGMKPLYKMTRQFLDIIQPRSKGNVISALGLDLSDKSVGTTQWEEVLKHYIGYTICIAIGIVFFIFMPLIGVCFCCCRCCGNCGGKPSEHQKSTDPTRRVVYGALLIAFNTMLLASVICFFLSNELIHDQTKTPNPVVTSLIHNLKVIDTYKTHTIEEIVNVVGDGAKEALDNIVKELNAAPTQVFTDLGRLTDFTPTLEAAEKLADRLSAINVSLTSVVSLTDSLVASQTELTSRLAAARTDLTAAAGLCGTSCANMTALSSSLASNADFTAVGDLRLQQNNIRNIVNNNFLELVRTGQVEAKKVISKVTNQTRKKIDDIKELTRSINGKIKKSTAAIIKSVEELNFTTNFIDNLNKNLVDVEGYGNSVWYAGIAVGCLMLLIVLFYYIGLLFGFCGTMPDEYAGLCNKGAGANMLLAGVGFTFLFTWLLMLMTFILFLFGGLAYTELCRHVADLSDVRQTQEFDRLLGDRIKIPFNLTISTMLHECSLNKPLYQVANLEQHGQLSQVLDISRYSGLMDELNQFNNLNFDLSDIELVSSETRQAFTDLANAKLDDIDFSAYKTELDKEITTASLLDSASQIRSAANRPGTPSPAASLLNTIAQTLTVIDAEVVVPMKANKEKLSVAVTKLKAAMESDSAMTFAEQSNAVLLAVENSQKNLISNGSKLIQNYLATKAEAVRQQVVNAGVSITNKLKNEVALCRTPFDVIQSTADLVCVGMLDPFNVVWFSLGWFVFAAVFCLVFAVWLAGLYRKGGPSLADMETKSFDAPNYNAYTGAYPENIALHDRGNRHQGARNAGYQPEYENSQGGRRNPPPHYNQF